MGVGVGSSLHKILPDDDKIESLMNGLSLKPKTQEVPALKTTSAFGQNFTSDIPPTIPEFAEEQLYPPKPTNPFEPSISYPFNNTSNSNTTQIGSSSNSTSTNILGVNKPHTNNRQLNQTNPYGIGQNNIGDIDRDNDIYNTLYTQQNPKRGFGLQQMHQQPQPQQQPIPNANIGNPFGFGTFMQQDNNLYNFQQAMPPQQNFPYQQSLMDPYGHMMMNPMAGPSQGNFMMNPQSMHNNQGMNNMYMRQFPKNVPSFDNNPYSQFPNMYGQPPQMMNYNGGFGNINNNNNNQNINQRNQMKRPNNNNNNNAYTQNNPQFNNNNNANNKGNRRNKNFQKGKNNERIIFSNANQGNPLQSNLALNPIIKHTIETATFDELYKGLPDICKDHPGSKIFEKIFGESTVEQKEMIISKLLPEVYSLSKDVFGNYVIQYLLDVTTPENRKKIIFEIYNRIKELSLHMYGCRVIQKAIEVCDINDLKQHLIELKDDLIKCVQDQNGNHVIQKLIEKLPKGYHGDIIHAVRGKVYQLSIHQYGCRAIQRIFEYCTKEEKECVLLEVFTSINELCLDQYGNYVIQNIVEKLRDRNQPIYHSIKGKVYDYSIHKFASNVIEKCLELGTKEQIAVIVSEIIEQDNINNDILLSLVRDKFGNYVVQKMIEVADMQSKESLVKKIIKTQVLKKRDGFSKHVMNMIEKLGLASLLDQSSGNSGNGILPGSNLNQDMMVPSQVQMFGNNEQFY